MSLIVKIEKKLKNFTLKIDVNTNSTCLGLLGSSGSGKSMTLKCIAGIEDADTGYIELNGRVLFDSSKKINLKPQERNVGYLFQNYALFPNMTVYENILIGTKDKKNSKEKIYEIIHRFNLEGFENQYPNKLSGGQQQRVALARMLMSNPEVLLFDEPFSALDSHLKDKLQLMLKDLLVQFNGNSIFVTHNRDEAYYFCEDIAIISNGEIIEKGNFKDVFAKPRTMDTARITGCKNISVAKTVSNNEIIALDWNLSFKLNYNLQEEYTYIGIRAKDFVLCNKDTENSFKCRVEKIIETPFEWMLLLEMPNNNLKNDKSSIWWRYSKNNQAKIYVLQEELYLRVDYENILLLL
ncbi:MAG: sulfate/molybdate ABC transporter ATP-binding protein [Lachnospirales bacterium]